MSLPAQSVLDLIGDTPMLEITRIDTGVCRLFAKLENQNPGGSIKDRVALSMIEAFERDGRLAPGGTLIEATAGNTGLGLALVAAQKGYRLILVIPDKMSREKVGALRALGAEVVMTRSDVNKGHPDYYQDKAQALAHSIPGAVFVNQFENPANPLAHQTGTGPEIWAQMGHDLDAVVVGVGSSGTLTGLSRFFAEAAPHVELVLADPAGSILADVVAGRAPRQPGSWLVEGIGEDFVPPIADLSRVTQAYSVTDAEAFEAARLLLRREGILGGSSAGALLAAALRYCRDQSVPKRVAFLVPDTGNKYLSKMYSDQWMQDHGMIQTPKRGDLRDLIARHHQDGVSVTLSPDDTLAVAYGRMKLYDVSQIPVLEGDRVVGLLDESDLLAAVVEDARPFDHTVSVAMVREVETLRVDATISALLPFFRRDLVAVVVDEADRYLGLITRIDLLNHFRRKVA